MTIRSNTKLLTFCYPFSFSGYHPSLLLIPRPHLTALHHARLTELDELKDVHVASQRLVLVVALHLEVPNRLDNNARKLSVLAEKRYEGLRFGFGSYAIKDKMFGGEM